MERRQWTKGAAALQELQELAHGEVWGREQATCGSLATAGLYVALHQ